MNLSAENFREQYQPLHVPAHYDINASDRDKVAYALAQIGEASAADVQQELNRNEPKIDQHLADEILNQLYDKGLIKGESRAGHLIFNLSKITHANGGSINSGLLAPGLD
jgi:hypothetical protein